MLKSSNGYSVGCKQHMDDVYGAAFGNITKNSRYSNDDEISRLKYINSINMFRKKKLHLVLDLDHTLIHSREIGKLRSGEKYLNEQHIFNDSLLKPDCGKFLVKLRPYVRTFLKEASSMFEMYVCTMSSRWYAECVVKLLDPDGEYFGSRIITLENYKQKTRKDLDLVLGQESGIIILDDSKSVWSDHSHNLIVAESYDYFKNKKRRGKSHAEKKTDESETNGVLANVLNVLKTIHRLFFYDISSFSCRDVRGLMGKVRSEVLKGCTIYISDGIHNFPLVRSKAEELGAAYTTVIDSTITHVISVQTGTKDCRWAEQEKKFVVHPEWLDAAYSLWRKQPEENYYLLSKENSCNDQCRL